MTSNKPDLQCYEEAIRGYEALINKPAVDEPELQSYFELYPILLYRGFKRVYAKKSFGGEAIPDFTAILHNNAHILIEIEKPSKQLYTKKGYATTEFSEAEQQVLDYMQWVNTEIDYLRRRGLPKISVENLRGLLVIGMRKNLTEEVRLQQKNYSVRATHEIKTFDDILNENIHELETIKQIAGSERSLRNGFLETLPFSSRVRSALAQRCQKDKHHSNLSNAW